MHHEGAACQHKRLLELFANVTEGGGRQFLEIQCVLHSLKRDNCITHTHTQALNYFDPGVPGLAKCPLWVSK